MPKKITHEEKHAQSDQELQKRYMTLQILKQQLTAMAEEKSALASKIDEISMTTEALKKLESIKKGEEIWSTMGSGAFVRSDIKDTDNVLVAAGAGIVVKETRQRGIEILSGRLDELRKIDEQLAVEITKFGTQVQRLELQLQHDVENR